MHGTHGFASALEEVQKLSLGKIVSCLGIGVYRILKVSALQFESERRGKTERDAGNADLVDGKEEVDDFAFVAGVLHHCRILQSVNTSPCGDGGASRSRING